MANKLPKKRAKYNCIIEEIDKKQIADLDYKIKDSPKLEPWLCTFVKRFSKLANKKEVSKKEISEACQTARFQSPQLKINREILPQSTLSSITNPESDNIRLPNVNHLIVLSKYFGVSIDYLVGLSKDPILSPISDSLGLTNKTLRLLMLYKEIQSIPDYSLYPKSGLPMTDDYDLKADELPSPDKDGFYTKYYYGKDCYSKNDIVEEMNNIISHFPDIFSESINAPLSKRKEVFDNIKPEPYFYETLELLLTYKYGRIINLLSQYLHLSEDADNIPVSINDNFSEERALKALLDDIDSELTCLRDEAKKATT